MSRSEHPLRDAALGPVASTAAIATYFSALVVWSRYCAAHKRRAQ